MTTRQQYCTRPGQALRGGARLDLVVLHAARASIRCAGYSRISRYLIISRVYAARYLIISRVYAAPILPAQCALMSSKEVMAKGAAPLSTLDDAILAQKICEAAEESCETGRHVAL